jgi:hypothetical protein
MQHMSAEVWLQDIVSEASAIARSFAHALGANCVSLSIVAPRTLFPLLSRHTSHQVRSFSVEQFIFERDEPNM